MRNEIEQILSAIQGHQIWAAGHAANMLWLQIGNRHIVPAWGGGIKEVGTYALHIDCPWSWSFNGALLATQESETQQLNELVSLPVVCQRIVVQDNGSFEIHFDNQTKFSVHVEADPDPLAEEFWRFFQPSSHEKHFVVGSGGIVE
jgi:hypothetical protein